MAGGVGRGIPHPDNSCRGARTVRTSLPWDRLNGEEVNVDANQTRLENPIFRRFEMCTFSFVLLASYAFDYVKLSTILVSDAIMLC